MKKIYIAIIALFLVAFSVVGLVEVSSSSATTYTTAINRKGQFVITQDAYLPDRTILGLGLDDPQDIFIYEDLIYIADTGNRRIAVYDPTINELIDEYVIDGFTSPKGLFISEDGTLYVADSGASSIFVFDADKNLIQTIEKPNSVSFANTEFDPKKVAVDGQGNMYVVAEGVYDGIIQLSSSGEFLGYFATNKVQLTPRQQLENLLFSERQQEQLVDRNPISFSNVYVDEKGIPYSTSFGEGISNLKKHNTDGSSSIDIDYGFDWSMLDVYTDDYGIIYTASQYGYIDIFTSDGQFIFAFGTEEDDEDITGYYSQLASIAVDSNGKIWTLDSDKAFLQSYVPTEYSQTIYEALSLYKEGKYDEAVIKWEEVLKLNQLSVLAHNEIGRNLFSQGNYEESMEHFILSGNRWLYSESYWEVRNESLQQNLPGVILGIFISIVAYYTIKFTNRKYHYLDKPQAKIRAFFQIRKINDVLYAFNLLKHPLDSFYYIKKKKKGSYLGATILFLIFFITYLIFLTSKGFIYQFTEVQDLDLNAIIIGFFAIFFLFIVSNYLVTSINDGEGTLGEIYKGISYSLMPVTIAMLVTTYLSHVLTYNELIILQLMIWTGYGLTGLFIFLAVQELHNYQIRDTIKSFLLTFLFMMIVALLLSFIQIMGDQLLQFIIGLFRENFIVTFFIIAIILGIGYGMSYLKKLLGGANNEI